MGYLCPECMEFRILWQLKFGLTPSFQHSAISFQLSRRFLPTYLLSGLWRTKREILFLWVLMNSRYLGYHLPVVRINLYNRPMTLWHSLAGGNPASRMGWALSAVCLAGNETHRPAGKPWSPHFALCTLLYAIESLIPLIFWTKFLSLPVIEIYRYKYSRVI